MVVQKSRQTRIVGDIVLSCNSCRETTKILCGQVNAWDNDSMQPASLYYFSCNSFPMKNVGIQVAYYHYPYYSCLSTFLYYHPYLFLQFRLLFISYMYL